ncbi:alanine--glyoxylate aminotransferase family protein [Tepidiforma sp.]|uniref:pyridoxal-phosphate-dependent aminotransferase family protein n=1 Tax=Tepidiforma sp. TaxID=2682230 RepID=UPI002ADD591B|nr:alanine--glyoxylate aminotransferase family protein [Tepidiforma sp.]
MPKDATFDPPMRILMGPGPSGAHPRVLQAMTRPLLGHLDPDFLRAMDGCRAMLREVMLTGNEVTLATPGTGTSGMEAAVMNLVEPGDRVVVGICGYFGERIAQMAERAGGEVTRVQSPWGEPADVAVVEAAVRAAGNVKLLAMVHAETSTGAETPVEPFARIARESGALLLVDCVTSLGGMPVRVDGWGADAVYSGTQKCLSAPPGVAPITFSERAWDAVRRREVPCNSWYLDLQLLEAYWDERRVYHHTAPIAMIYALHEALALVLEEGLEARWARHERNGRALQAGLEAMGLRLYARAGYRLPVLTTVCIPEGVDDAAVRGGLLHRFGIEIGGGLGELRGRVWRVGLMGESSTAGNVLLLLNALGRLLREQGFRADVRAGVEVAAARLEAG